MRAAGPDARARAVALPMTVNTAPGTARDDRWPHCSTNQRTPSAFGGQCSPPRNVTRNGLGRGTLRWRGDRRRWGSTWWRRPAVGPRTASRSSRSPTPRRSNRSTVRVRTRQLRCFLPEQRARHQIRVMRGQPLGHLEDGVVLIQDLQSHASTEVGQRCHPQLIGVEGIEAPAASNRLRRASISGRRSRRIRNGVSDTRLMAPSRRSRGASA